MPTSRTIAPATPALAADTAMPPIGAAPVLGIPLALIDYEGALNWIDAMVAARRRGYVCVAAVHTVMASHEDPELRAAVLGADLADPAAVAGLVPAARAALGPLGVLVNNASVFEPDAVGGLDLALWERHFAVNLRAPVFLAEAFAAQVEGEGAVVNLIDQRVWKLTPRFFSYTLSKAALWTATRTLAQALAPRVRVNGIGPGPTFASARQAPEDFARQQAALPLGRGPSPEEIATAVRFLIEARTVTGQMIALDGGQHLAWQTPDAGIRE